MFFVTFTVADVITLAGQLLVWTGIWAALSGQIEAALSALIIAMLLDALDGKVARALGVARPFGRYLGSFVDLVNYTVAPPLILYKMGYSQWWCLTILFIFSTCGMIRLAKFNEVGNVTVDDRLHYLGLPVFWIHVLLVIVYVIRGTHPSIFVGVTTVGLLILSPCFLLDRPFYKPQNYPAIITVSLIAAAIFGRLATSP